MILSNYVVFTETECLDLIFFIAMEIIYGVALTFLICGHVFMDLLIGDGAHLVVSLLALLQQSLRLICMAHEVCDQLTVSIH